MSALLRKLTKTNNQRVTTPTNHAVRTHCNYADNYYGDQVCVEVKIAKPRPNLHVAVQL